MISMVTTLFLLFLVVHGLIHLMGFVAYWPLAEMAELPYKTTIAGGQWNLGAQGMRLFSLLWLITALAFVAGAAGQFTQRSWWLPLLLAAAGLSLLITALDWANAFRGTIISLLLLLVLGVALGLKQRPALLPDHPPQSASLATMPLPAGLPDPVDRFYRAIAGDQIPLTETAVFGGRGTMRVAGITFQARTRMVNDRGQAYWHLFDATFFGRRLMRAEESFVNGQARMDTPAGHIENDPDIDSAANLALWAEVVMLPSQALTQPEVRWEAIDDSRARLIVPSAEGQDSFTVEFDPETGLLLGMEAIRYRDADKQRAPWRMEPRGWQEVQGLLLPVEMLVIWPDEGTPWLTFELEEVTYNADVSAYFAGIGQ